MPLPRSRVQAFHHRAVSRLRALCTAAAGESADGHDRRDLPSIPSALQLCEDPSAGLESPAQLVRGLIGAGWACASSVVDVSVAQLRINCEFGNWSTGLSSAQCLEQTLSSKALSFLRSACAHVRQSLRALVEDFELCAPERDPLVPCLRPSAALAAFVTDVTGPSGGLAEDVRTVCEELASLSF